MAGPARPPIPHVPSLLMLADQAGNRRLRHAGYRHQIVSCQSLVRAAAALIAKSPQRGVDQAINAAPVKYLAVRGLTVGPESSNVMEALEFLVIEFYAHPLMIPNSRTLF